ncbi:MAG: hypothetical protein ACR2PF_05335 [Rhizobiaceae bacterium]
MLAKQDRVPPQMMNHSPRLSLVELIASFQTTNDQLRNAIEQDNTELVEPLDRQMTAQFDTLLSFSPTNVEDASELITLLLEIIIPRGAETTLAEQVKTKIISIVAATFD